ncbi:unnamed protein product [Cylicocyclus nassatus]|uniref:Uncharacterized protein n=1 Tax=Cylicocyclus nassatus TaxID=53992 RepID=A0AA36GQN8_CYLNA|nr:unnamed protein product [Cylicocyclus nassatus]
MSEMDDLIKANREWTERLIARQKALHGQRERYTRESELQEEIHARGGGTYQGDVQEQGQGQGGGDGSGEKTVTNQIIQEAAWAVKDKDVRIMGKINDDVLIEAYERLGNVWKVGDELGISGQKVYARLDKLGLVRKMNRFTKEDEEFLLLHYQEYKDRWDLKTLAEMMGRTVPFISRKAKALGLTSYGSKMPEDKRLNQGRIMSERIKREGHSRGMLGKHHSEEFKRKMSERVRSEWKDPGSAHNTEENRQRRSDVMHQSRMNGTISSSYSIGKRIDVDYGTKHCTFRSTWEKSIADILESYKSKGWVAEWTYEEVVFDFPLERRGVRSYRPDFEITKANGDKVYFEVKGWMTPKGKKGIDLMRKYYANVELIIIDEDEYKQSVSETDYLRRYCL